MSALVLDLLRSRRGLLAGISIALLVVSIGYLALYPSLEEQLTTMAEDLPDVYTALLGDVDLASPTGYIRSQVYSLLGPLLVVGGCIAAGSGLARAERDRTLAIFVVTPLDRHELAGAWVGFVVAVAVLCGLAIVVGVSIGAPLAGADVSFGSLLAATIPIVVFGVFVGGVALVVAAATGAPGTATATGWGLVAAAFVANSIAELIDSASWLAEISPWSWHASGRAVDGPADLLGLGLLTAAAAIALAVAANAFGRRNLHL